MKKQTKIISVGGSIVIPKTGFNAPFLRKFKKMILDETKKGTRFVLVIGGGTTARQYQDGLKKTMGKVSSEDLDWMGIGATIINATFVKLMFGDAAYKDVITDPRKQIKTSKKVIIAAGYKPGCSTDMDAVLLAKAYKADEVLNLSNIEYAYDKDPNKYKSAKRIDEMDWKTFRKDVVGYTWKPGMSAPFDPIASGLAEKMNLKVGILNGTQLPNVKKAIQGKPFKGSRIGDYS